MHEGRRLGADLPLQTNTGGRVTHPTGAPAMGGSAAMIEGRIRAEPDRLAGDGEPVAPTSRAALNALIKAPA